MIPPEIGKDWIITTAAPDIIDMVVEVKINGVLYSIRMAEESFGDNFNRFLSEWKYQNYVNASSDDEDSVVNNILMVSATELTARVRDEDLQLLHKEFSNPGFGKCVSPLENMFGSCKGGTEVGVAQDSYAHPTAALQQVQSKDREGVGCARGTISAFQKAGVISRSHSTMLEDLGHLGSHVRFKENLVMGNNLHDSPKSYVPKEKKKKRKKNPNLYGSALARLQRGRFLLKSSQPIGQLEFGLDDISCSQWAFWERLLTT